MSASAPPIWHSAVVASSLAELLAALTPERREDALRVARALLANRVVTLDEVSEATGLEPESARALLRAFVQAQLATMQLATSGGCSGRREGPQFFFRCTPAGLESFAGAGLVP